MAIGLLIGFIVAVVITLAWATTQPSGAAGGEAAAPSADSRARSPRATAPVNCPPGSKPAGVGCIDKHPVYIVACSAKRAVKFYAGRIAYWRTKMGAASSRDAGRTQSSGKRCPRYLAHVLQRKAYGLRKAYARWVDYQWNWEAWLPDKFARVGACETGYGKRPGSWTWDTRQFDANGHFVGGYVSAFGIYAPAYEQYHRWTGHNTPREQYEVAAAIQARFGWGAWGCGGA